MLWEDRDTTGPGTTGREHNMLEARPYLKVYFVFRYFPGRMNNLPVNPMTENPLDGFASKT